MSQLFSWMEKAARNQNRFCGDENHFRWDAAKPGHRKWKPVRKILSHEASCDLLRHEADCHQRS